jgi:hypothetical protein
MSRSLFFSRLFSAVGAGFLVFAALVPASVPTPRIDAALWALAASCALLSLMPLESRP